MNSAIRKCEDPNDARAAKRRGRNWRAKEIKTAYFAGVVVHNLRESGLFPKARFADNIRVSPQEKSLRSELPRRDDDAVGIGRRSDTRRLQRYECKEHNARGKQAK